jgi:hypothetical protein
MAHSMDRARISFSSKRLKEVMKEPKVEGYKQYKTIKWTLHSGRGSLQRLSKLALLPLLCS